MPNTMPSFTTSAVVPTLRWQAVSHPALSRQKTTLWLCHVDSDSLMLSGNKILKLRYPLQSAQQQGKSGIFTFGGAFSNHLPAVATACKQAGLKSIGYVRTDRLDMTNPTLRYCSDQRMQLFALTRQQYRLRQDEMFIAELQNRHATFLHVPEGGSSAEGAKGLTDVDFSATPNGTAQRVCCAAASGGMLAGMINNTVIPSSCEALGIAVVKDASLEIRVKQLVLPNANRHWQLLSHFTGPGYARFDSSLLQFCRQMAQQKIYVEPVYTGKALYGLLQLIEQGYFSGQTLSFFHSGGLQGLNGLHYMQLISSADLALLSGSEAH